MPVVQLHFRAYVPVLDVWGESGGTGRDGYLSSVYKYLMGGNEEEGTRLLSVAVSDRQAGMGTN